MSLFDLLNIGSRGLSASQVELDVVGQNVTNADTDGYSRKQVNLTAGVRKDAALGQMGYGVDVVDVKSVRDKLLDRQIQSVSIQQGGSQQLDDSLQLVQNIFTEPSDSGLNTYLDKFWSSWQDLANSPSDPTARQAVLDAGQALVGRFNNVGNQLVSLYNQTNDQIGNTVDDINTLLTGIDQDNQTIAQAEVGGTGNANDTRDAREQKLEKLSSLLDISYTEDAQGRLTVTASGNLLVSPAGTFPLQVRKDAYTQPDGSQSTRSTLVLSSTRQELVPQGGKLASLIQVRDDVIPRYQAQVDKLATTLVESVNAVHRTGYDLTGTTGSDFFDPTTSGASTIALSSTVKAGVEYIAAAQGAASQSLGAPIATAVTAAGTPLSLTNINTNYRNLVSKSVSISTVGPPPVALKEGAGYDYVVDYQSGQIWFNNPAVYPAGTAVTVDFKYNPAAYNGEGDGS